MNMGKYALTTYRCPRGCTLGHIVKLPERGVVQAIKERGQWVFYDHDEPGVVVCRHLTGIMPFTDKAQGHVTLTQDDVRTLPPGARLDREKYSNMSPLTLEMVSGKRRD